MSNASVMTPEGALEKLDTLNVSAFYWLLTLLSTLGGFLFGYDTSNIGVVQASSPMSLTMR
ncbi:MAG: hypothetical protein QXP70_00485 [Methanomassiliicoccales archaeon]